MLAAVSMIAIVAFTPAPVSMFVFTVAIARDMRVAMSTILATIVPLVILVIHDT